MVAVVVCRWLLFNVVLSFGVYCCRLLLVTSAVVVRRCWLLYADVVV